MHAPSSQGFEDALPADLAFGEEVVEDVEVDGGVLPRVLSLQAQGGEEGEVAELVAVVGEE
jgi:hypothetical protein